MKDGSLYVTYKGRLDYSDIEAATGVNKKFMYALVHCRDLKEWEEDKAKGIDLPESYYWLTKIQIRIEAERLIIPIPSIFELVKLKASSSMDFREIKWVEDAC